VSKKYPLSKRACGFHKKRKKGQGNGNIRARKKTERKKGIRRVGSAAETLAGERTPKKGVRIVPRKGPGSERAKTKHPPRKEREFINKKKPLGLKDAIQGTAKGHTETGKRKRKTEWQRKAKGG